MRLESLKNKIRYKIYKIIFNRSSVLKNLGLIYLRKKFDIKANDLALISIHHSGETYLLCSLANSIKKQYNIDRIILIGTRTYHRQIYEMFSHQVDGYVLIDGHLAYCLRYLRKIKGGKIFYITDHFLWNKFSVQHLDNTQILKLGCCIDNETAKILPPKILEKNISSANKKFIDLGLKKDKTIFIAPESISTAFSDHSFWRQLCSELREKGYDIFLNIMNPDNAIDGVKTAYLNFSEAVVFAENCKNVIALRSGFCEIISSAVNTKFHILYLNNADIKFYPLDHYIRPENMVKHVINNQSIKQLIDNIVGSFN